MDLLASLRSRFTDEPGSPLGALAAAVAAGAERGAEPPHSEFLCGGEYLGRRLVELGARHVFAVPGDFSLSTLDALALAPGLTIVNTANELGAGYAADGQARANGTLGCLCVTWGVGAFSALNAVACAFAERVPVLVVVGCPSTVEYASHKLALHHSLGDATDLSQQAVVFRPVTCHQGLVRSLRTARNAIDAALATALTHRRPALLEFARDLPLTPHPSFGARAAAPPPFAPPRAAADAAALGRAAAALAAWLRGKRAPLIAVGAEARRYPDAVARLAEASGFAVCCLHEAKGIFPEDHPSSLGTYFARWSDPVAIAETYAASDAVILLGASFGEFDAVAAGEALERSAVLGGDAAWVPPALAFNGVPTAELLEALAASGALERNDGARRDFAARPKAPPVFPSHPDFRPPAGAPLTAERLFAAVQARILDAPGGGAWSVIAETGDLLWRSFRLKLPRTARYESQLLAGSIGWATPAGLGYSLAAAAAPPGAPRAAPTWRKLLPGGAPGGGAVPRRTLILTGDGALQMTANELGNYARYKSNAVMIILNNDGYLVERYISKEAGAGYNNIAAWDYCAVAKAMCGAGRVVALKAASDAELDAALDAVHAHPNAFIVIEAALDRRDAAPGAAVMREGFLALQAPLNRLASSIRVQI
jgi:pyruvate decarboxylase